MTHDLTRETLAMLEREGKPYLAMKARMPDEVYVDEDCDKELVLLAHAAQCVREVAALRRQVETQAAELDKWREREASVCPEDFGFEEVIATLRAKADQLGGQGACVHMLGLHGAQAITAGDGARALFRAWRAQCMDC